MANRKVNKSTMAIVLILGIFAFILSQVLLGNLIEGLSVLIETISSIVISVVLSYLILSEMK